MKQKTLITDSDSKINELIEQGWKVVSITALHVASGSTYPYYGKVCVLFEKAE